MCCCNKSNSKEARDEIEDKFKEKQGSWMNKISSGTQEKIIIPSSPQKTPPN